MTFNEWLRTAKRTDDPAGDFIDDARRDRSLPEIATASQLMTYLVVRGAPSEAIAAVPIVWKRYERARHG